MYGVWGYTGPGIFQFFLVYIGFTWTQNVGPAVYLLWSLFSFSSSDHRSVELEHRGILGFGGFYVEGVED